MANKGPADSRNTPTTKTATAGKNGVRKCGAKRHRPSRRDPEKEHIIAWLKSRFRIDEHSPQHILKNHVYADYVAMCHGRNIVPVSNAVFGKLLHKAFPSVQKSRLMKGNDGRCKYYYSNLHPQQPLDLRYLAPDLPNSSSPSPSGFSQVPRQQQQQGIEGNHPEGNGSTNKYTFNSKKENNSVAQQQYVTQQQVHHPYGYPSMASSGQSTAEIEFHLQMHTVVRGDGDSSNSDLVNRRSTQPTVICGYPTSRPTSTTFTSSLSSSDMDESSSNSGDLASFLPSSPLQQEEGEGSAVVTDQATQVSVEHHQYTTQHQHQHHFVPYSPSKGINPMTLVSQYSPTHAPISVWATFWAEYGRYTESLKMIGRSYGASGTTLNQARALIENWWRDRAGPFLSAGGQGNSLLHTVTATGSFVDAVRRRERETFGAFAEAIQCTIDQSANQQIGPDNHHSIHLSYAHTLMQFSTHFVAIIHDIFGIAHPSANGHDSQSSSSSSSSSLSHGPPPEIANAVVDAAIYVEGLFNQKAQFMIE